MAALARGATPSLRHLGALLPSLRESDRDRLLAALHLLSRAPALQQGAARLLTFVAPALWLSGRAGFELEDVWWLSVASQLVEALTSLWLMRVEFRARLGATKGSVNPPDGIPAPKGRS